MKANHHIATPASLLARLAAKRWACWFVLVSLLLMPGCGGCQQNQGKNQTPKQKLAAKKKKRKKDPFEFGRIYSLPTDPERGMLNFKPGHWTEFTSEVRANHNDFLGDLVTDPLKLDGMPFRLGSSRPAVLPKGVKKYLGTVVFAPPGGGARQLHIRLTARGSSRGLKEQLTPAGRMKSWCFSFLVLAANPDDYVQLFGHRGLDALRPSATGYQAVGFQPYYFVRIPKLGRYVPVSENSLTWTNTAYILWDGIPPSLLTEEQQKALVDWIHWGGQLIVSGPDSLDTLKDSFLARFLPATGEEDIALGDKDLVSFNANWNNADFNPPDNIDDVFDEQGIQPPGAPAFPRRAPPARARRGQKPRKTELQKARPLKVEEPWSAKKLVLANADVESLVVSDREDKAPLVVDRRVGRGRIVLTAFRLSQHELRLTNWPSFDAFLNGCLLRRPPRTFSSPDGLDVAVDRKDNRDRFDAHRVSRVRYYTRDARLQVRSGRKHPLDGEIAFEDEGIIDDRPVREDYGNRFGMQSPDDGPSVTRAAYGPGVAGWSDFNHTGQIVRQSLEEAAGIVIPKADFVVYILAVYLLVLVPLNWLVFRLMGRVEWAWIAAPAITVVCAVAVIKLAELDIGFARSRSELAVVEIQGDYRRAHVTRYTGLYTSLSTSYDVRFDDPASLVQPFAAYSKQKIAADPSLGFGEVTDVHYRRDDNVVTLTGFNVKSNSTEMLHSEHMLDVGGGIALADTPGGYDIVNRTPMNLKGAAVISRGGVAWIGDFDSGVKKQFILQRRPAGDLNHWFREREESELTSRLKRDDLLKSRLLVRMAEHVDTLDPGEMRLVAWTDEELPGMQISPRASQARFANVIVARLKYGEILYGKKGNQDHDSREKFEFKPELKFESPDEGEKKAKDVTTDDGEDDTKE